MKSLILKIYAKAYKAKVLNKYKETNKALWILCLSLMYLSQLGISVYLVFYKIFGILPTPLDKNEKLSISLTSFPARINMVWKTIDSLFHQQLPPKEINLYLSIDEFPQKYDDLPESLKRYIPLGLNIKFVKGNIKPHKKYHYFFEECLSQSTDKLFVTVDDDVYYLPDMLSNLYELHEKFPKSICSNVVHHVRPGQPYKCWDSDCIADYPSKSYIAIGCGGILYDTSLFKNRYFLNIHLLNNLCPIADDIWLKAAELVNDIPVVTGNFNIPFINIIGTQKHALWKKNTNSKEYINNDTQWDNTISYIKQYKPNIEFEETKISTPQAF